MRTLLRLIVIGALMTCGAEAAQSAVTAPCDAIAAQVRGAADSLTGARTVWSFVTSGTDPLIDVATNIEVSLGAGPMPDERVEFEKRLRAYYGNVADVIKDTRSFENFDILSLRGSQVRMLLNVSGDNRCESRYFFRVNTAREGIRIPAPPTRTSDEAANAICQSLGGWGLFARIGGVEGFVEYHSAADEESIRIVPLTTAGWQPGCTLSAKFASSATTGKRDRLESVLVK